MLLFFFVLLFCSWTLEHDSNKEILQDLTNIPNVYEVKWLTPCIMNRGAYLTNMFRFGCHRESKVSKIWSGFEQFWVWYVFDKIVYDLGFKPILCLNSWSVSGGSHYPIRYSQVRFTWIRFSDRNGSILDIRFLRPPLIMSVLIFSMIVDFYLFHSQCEI